MRKETNETDNNVLTVGTRNITYSFSVLKKEGAVTVESSEGTDEVGSVSEGQYRRPSKRRVLGGE